METRNCQNCREYFAIELNDFGFYEKIGVPAPTLCPICRSQRRLAWRNTYNLYNRNCDLCGKNTISMYSSDSPLTVYCVKCFWSDNWDPYSYGIPYDATRSFVDQYIELSRKVPKPALIKDDGIASINSPFCNDIAFSKNCYMVFIAWHVENSFYSNIINEGREICDTLGVGNFCEFMYESMMVDGCYKCRNVIYGNGLQNCDFCYDCRECSDCFMCYGLRNKKYYYKNQQYSKEDYEKILESYALYTRTGWEKAKKEFEEFILKAPRKFAMITNSVNCTGNDMLRAKNTKDSFFAPFSEDSRYVINGATFKNCYDLSGGGETERAYEALTPDHSYNNFFSTFSWKNKDIAWCENCHSSNNLFGCASLKKGEYSILNKKYPKEEYAKIKKEIIDNMIKDGTWGEFFPAQYSHFAYNETEALDLHPISKEESVKKGFKWQENLQRTMGKESMNQNQVPENIQDVPDSFTEEVLACKECSRNYKITENELIFYKRMNVPIPQYCFFCRNTKRIKSRNPFKLWHRGCMCDKQNHFHGERKCEVEFQTSYSPDRPEIVYCEKCYQAEVY